jgi:hypothetical protein
MQAPFVYQQIQRTNQKLLTANAALVLAVLAFGAFTYRYWYNFALGPFKVDTQTLADLKNPEEATQQFVVIQGDRSFNTGVQQITQRVNRRTGQKTSESVSAQYLALQTGKRFLIVKATENLSSTQFTGSLTTIPSEVYSRIVSPIESQRPEMKGVFFASMLDTGDYRLPGYIGLVIGLPLLALGGWNLSKAWLRKSNPSQHPLAKKLSQFGDWQALSNTIDMELNREDTTFRTKTFVLTTSWLFLLQTYNTNAIRLDQSLWVYKKVTTHRSYGIPVGKTFALVICDRTGKTTEVAGKEPDIDRVLVGICSSVPWVLAGYSDELLKLWRKRADMIEIVDQRRAQMQ